MSGVKLGYQERASPLNEGFNRPNFRFTNRPLGRDLSERQIDLSRINRLATQSPSRSRTEVGGPSDHISSDDHRAQRISRIFTGSISSVARTATTDGSTSATGRLRYARGCGPRFQSALFLSAGSANSKRSFGVKTRVDFRMNLSPELCEPTRS